MNQNDTDYSAKIEALLEQGLVSPQAQELITELETELDLLRKQMNPFAKRYGPKQPKLQECLPSYGTPCTSNIQQMPGTGC
ncbi:hypothetical protein [Paenibacillus sp. IHB B 3084]|uniref:hypothetical protein n=1 Tax=Paenibacillus sp. IHB B 3084 TaxID=867076 RepID=UPI000B240245|nr:hypothetical protein [Paenibacillus sp. IHB B 3084]